MTTERKSVNHRAKAAHAGGTIGGPCNTIKSDGYWCSQKAVVVIDGYGYCKRHSHKPHGPYAPIPADER